MLERLTFCPLLRAETTHARQPAQPVKDTRSQPEGSTEQLKEAVLNQGFDLIERDDPRLPRRSSDVPSVLLITSGEESRLRRLDFLHRNLTQYFIKPMVL
jgi:hypothetical protein